MESQTSSNAETEVPRELTKKELQDFLEEIEKKVVESDKSTVYSMVALNHILRAPNAVELVDDELKGQIRDLWLKVKSTGLQLADPPLIFGVPEGAIEEEVPEPAEVEEVEASDNEAGAADTGKGA